MSNIVEAMLRERTERTIYTKNVYQHDTGVVLRILGIELPEKYEVHFSNEKDRGISAAKIVRDTADVNIPDVYLQSGEWVYVWLYLRDDNDKGYTTKQIIIPVERRPAILEMGDGSGDGQIVASLGTDEDEHTLIFQYA